MFTHNYINDQKIFTKTKSGVFIGYDKTIKIALVYDADEDKIIKTSAFTELKNEFPFRQEKGYENRITEDRTRDMNGNDDTGSSSHNGIYDGG